MPKGFHLCSFALGPFYRRQSPNATSGILALDQKPINANRRNPPIHIRKNAGSDPMTLCSNLQQSRSNNFPQSLLNKSRVKTFDSTSDRSSFQRFAIMISQLSLKILRSCTTSLPQNSSTSSVGSYTTTGTP